MARRNSGGQGRGGFYAAPAPLYDRVEELRGPAAPVRSSALTALEETDMHIHRYPSPRPALSGPAGQDTAELLRQQNSLLTEILGVLNAQLAVGLGQRPQ